MATKFQTRPSALVGLNDPYWAWCFDEVAWIWSSHVDSKLHEVWERYKEKPEVAAAMRKQTMDTLLDIAELPTTTHEQPTMEEPSAGKFRDPAAMFN
jgi:hypothetical protein